MSYLEEFKKEVQELKNDIEKAMAIMALAKEKHDGLHRCYKCAEIMCEVSLPYGTDKYFQCFTTGCSTRKEFVE